MVAWKKLLSYDPRISQLPNGWRCFHFMKDEYVREVMRRAWVHGCCFLALHRWTMDFHPINNAPKNHIIWVRMTGLLIQLWSTTVLKAIGDSINICKFVDLRSVGLFDKRVAWVLVEVFFVGGLPTNIDLEWIGIIYRWSLDYWKIPFLCHLCHRTGHLMNSCRGWRPGHTAIVKDAPQQ